MITRYWYTVYVFFTYQVPGRYQGNHERRVSSLSVCFPCRLLRYCYFFSLLCFPWWILFFWYFVSATSPPRSLLPWSMRIPRACCLLAFMMIFSFFLLFVRFFRFRFVHRLFHPVIYLWVLCGLGFGFCCDSFSIRTMVRVYTPYQQQII